MAGGAAAQSSIDELDSYASPKAGMAGNFQKVDELNRDKLRLDKQEEYVFELIDRKLLKNSPGFNGKGPVDKLLLTWKEVQTGNIVQNSFRIDSLVWNEQKPNFQSPVITFFENIDYALPKNPEKVKEPGFWGPKFIKSMKIRARITPGKSAEGVLIPGKYTLELATVRKYKA